MMKSETTAMLGLRSGSMLTFLWALVGGPGCHQNAGAGGKCRTCAGSNASTQELPPVVERWRCDAAQRLAVVLHRPSSSRVTLRSGQEVSRMEPEIGQTWTLEGIDVLITNLAFGLADQKTRFVEYKIPGNGERRQTLSLFMTRAVYKSS